jgi:Co/Zn/Cd efflux system component
MNKSPSETVFGTAGAGAMLVVAIAVTIIAAFVGLAVIPIPLGPIIGIAVIYAVWSKFKDTASLATANAEIMVQSKKEIERFDTMFRIVDEHVVLKSKSHADITKTVQVEEVEKHCTFCGKAIEKSNKFCPYCGKATQV